MADFRHVNNLINQLSWIMMQNWLGKQGHQRQMKYLGEQQKGWRGLSQFQHELGTEADKGRAELTRQNAVQKALLEASKDQNLMYHMKMARIGPEADRQMHLQEYEKLLIPYAESAMATMGGKPTAGGVEAMV